MACDIVLGFYLNTIRNSARLRWTDCLCNWNRCVPIGVLLLKALWAPASLSSLLNKPHRQGDKKRSFTRVRQIAFIQNLRGRLPWLRNCIVCGREYPKDRLRFCLRDVPLSRLTWEGRLPVFGSGRPPVCLGWSPRLLTTSLVRVHCNKGIVRHVYMHFLTRPMGRPAKAQAPRR